MRGLERANKSTCVRARARFGPALSAEKTMDDGDTGSWKAPGGGWSRDV